MFRSSWSSQRAFPECFSWTSHQHLTQPSINSWCWICLTWTSSLPSSVSYAASWQTGYYVSWSGRRLRWRCYLKSAPTLEPLRDVYFSLALFTMYISDCRCTAKDMLQVKFSDDTSHKWKLTLSCREEACGWGKDYHLLIVSKTKEIVMDFRRDPSLPAYRSST